MLLVCSYFYYFFRLMKKELCWNRLNCMLGTTACTMLEADSKCLSNQFEPQWHTYLWSLLVIAVCITVFQLRVSWKTKKEPEGSLQSRRGRGRQSRSASLTVVKDICCLDWSVSKFERGSVKGSKWQRKRGMLPIRLLVNRNVVSNNSKNNGEKDHCQVCWF